MDMGVLKQFLRDEALSVQPFTIGETSPGKRPKSTGSNNNANGTPSNEEKTKPLTSHRIIMDIIIK